MPNKEGGENHEISSAGIDNVDASDQSHSGLGLEVEQHAL
jgi:hypothetical protein